MIIQQAKTIATQYHQDQWRTAGYYEQGKLIVTGKLPYIVHPKNVAQILASYGYNDETTQAIAWLHDTLEDTALTHEQLQQLFGKEIAQGVYILTRNVERDEYKHRLLQSGTGVQVIKIADTLDNLFTLDALTSRGIERKINDCQEFYIPLGRKIAPELTGEMETVLNAYLQGTPVQVPAYAA